MSLLSEFNKFFYFRLNQCGFFKLKGSHIFVRIINNEIVQYITYRGVPSLLKSKKAFSMMGGIESLYSECLTKINIQAHAFDYKSFRWLDPSINNKGAFWNVFHYDDNTITTALNNAAHDTEFILNHFNKVTDLYSYIRFCKSMALVRLYYADQLNLDSILLVKTGNNESFHDVIEKKVFYIAQSNPHLYKDSSLLSKYRQEVFEEIQEGIIKPRDRVYNNADLMKKTIIELERRRDANTNILLDLGIEF